MSVIKTTPLFWDCECVYPLGEAIYIRSADESFCGCCQTSREDDGQPNSEISEVISWDSSWQECPSCKGGCCEAAVYEWKDCQSCDGSGIVKKPVWTFCQKAQGEGYNFCRICNDKRSELKG